MQSYFSKNNKENRMLSTTILLSASTVKEENNKGPDQAARVRKLMCLCSHALKVLFSGSGPISWLTFTYGPHHAKTCLRALRYADSKGPDRPAHPLKLIRAFTVR